MTNYEEIKNMNIDEMAKELYYMEISAHTKDVYRTLEEIKEWLKTEIGE